MALLAPPAADGRIVLARRARASRGLPSCTTDGGCGRRYIMETVCAGLATFDYDGDGLIDVYFLNAPRLRTGPADPPPAQRRCTAIWAAGKFADVTAAAGGGDLATRFWSGRRRLRQRRLPRSVSDNYDPTSGITTTRWTFTRFSVPAGVQGGEQMRAGAWFVDAEADGNLDLFAATTSNSATPAHDGHDPRRAGVCSPAAVSTRQNRFYRNQGDGTFADRSDESGIGQHASWGMGTVCGRLRPRRRTPTSSWPTTWRRIFFLKTTVAGISRKWP